MFTRIFLFVLLLTCAYTYMLKSIKDNNYSNFQKLPYNLNVELNVIQPLKPNLKSKHLEMLYDLLEKIIPEYRVIEFFKIVFGNDFYKIVTADRTEMNN